MDIWSQSNESRECSGREEHGRDRGRGLCKVQGPAEENHLLIQISDLPHFAVSKSAAVVQF